MTQPLLPGQQFTSQIANNMINQSNQTTNFVQNSQSGNPLISSTGKNPTITGLITFNFGDGRYAWVQTRRVRNSAGVGSIYEDGVVR